jgi:glycosyltransferase involved in cell wall biosynthesis
LERHLKRIRVHSSVAVIHNGIGSTFLDGTGIPLPRGDGPLRLIAIGTLDSRKNFEEAIRAVSATSNTHLTIVGDGPLRNDLADQIGRAGLLDRVNLVGARSDIPALLDQHHALLSTSKFEGFGLVAAEAMSRGCPVIAPNVPGLREVVVDGVSGLLYSRNENPIPEIAALISRLRDDNELYALLAKSAVQRSKQFSILEAAHAYIEQYKRLLKTNV